VYGHGEGVLIVGLLGEDFGEIQHLEFLVIAASLFSGHDMVPPYRKRQICLS
jgi:hypothetical protein